MLKIYLSRKEAELLCEKYTPTKKELQMPARAETMRQVFAYLCKTRGIPGVIVQELAHSGLLYQSEHRTDTIVNGQPKTYHNANAVFVHRDAKGTIIGAEIQGCNSDRRYKGIAPGTGASAFMFTPVPARDGKIRRAYIFESAIDLLSFYTFCENKSKLTGSVLVSMAGLKPTVPKQLQAQICCGNSRNICHTRIEKNRLQYDAAPRYWQVPAILSEKNHR